MAYQDKTPAHIRLDERNHIEKPLLVQLVGLDWWLLLVCARVSERLK